jgi:hypothetical protein
VKYIACLFSAIVVALAAAVTVLMVMMFLGALYPEPTCAAPVVLSDLDAIREAWNTEMATAPHLDSNEDVARLIESNPACCTVVRVAPPSLRDRFANGGFTEIPAVVVYLTFAPAANATNAKTRVDFDRCGRKMPTD